MTNVDGDNSSNTLVKSLEVFMNYLKSPEYKSLEAGTQSFLADNILTGMTPQEVKNGYEAVLSSEEFLKKWSKANQGDFLSLTLGSLDADDALSAFKNILTSGYFVGWEPQNQQELAVSALSSFDGQPQLLQVYQAVVNSDAYKGWQRDLKRDFAIEGLKRLAAKDALAEYKRFLGPDFNDRVDNSTRLNIAFEALDIFPVSDQRLEAYRTGINSDAYKNAEPHDQLEFSIDGLDKIDDLDLRVSAYNTVLLSDEYNNKWEPEEQKRFAIEGLKKNRGDTRRLQIYTDVLGSDAYPKWGVDLQAQFAYQGLDACNSSVASLTSVFTVATQAHVIVAMPRKSLSFEFEGSVSDTIFVFNRYGDSIQIIDRTQQELREVKEGGIKRAIWQYFLKVDMQRLAKVFRAVHDGFETELNHEARVRLLNEIAALPTTEASDALTPESFEIQDLTPRAA